jgi:WD40 repeat protein
MSITSAEALFDAVRAYSLLGPGGRGTLAPDLPRRFADPEGLARELVRLNWLTPFQAERLLAGQGRELVLGSYRLLEPLGAGGMGQVFKARHLLMDRLVALKLLRSDLLTELRFARRFHREVRLAARLSHPNIVVAHDAEQIDGRLFLVMEYCDGIDLGRLIDRDGPLPVRRACDYVRQAAKGVQYAFGQGLVHRDLKPENLLLAGGKVKVLDFGLACLHEPGAHGSGLTSEGAFMGTADFTAPEQASDAHSADTRADIYSLGCTLYFLLTGQVPFPGGSLMEKLLRHRLEEPRPLEELRPDVPAEVGGVVRTMMAKQRQDRYQTPAEAVAALRPWAGARQAPAGAPVPVKRTGAAPTAAKSTGLAPTLPPGPARVVRGRRDAKATQASAHAPRRFANARWALTTGAALVVALTIGLIAIMQGTLPREQSSSEGNSQPRSPEGAGPALVPAPPAVRPAPGAQWRPQRTFHPQAGTVFGVALSPDGRFLAVACGNEDMPAGRPGQVVLFPADGSPPVPLGQHRHSAQHLAFTPDSAALISAAGTGLPNFNLPGEVKFWDVAARTERQSFLASEVGIHALALAPRGGRLAVGGRDASLKVLDATTGATVQDLPSQWKTVYTALVFSADGSLLISGEGTGQLKVWDVAQGRERFTMPVPRDELTFVSGLAFLPGGRRLVGTTGVPHGGEARIKIWNLDTQRLERFIRHGEFHIFCMALHPDGNTLATGCQDGVIRLWDLGRGVMTQEMPDHGSSIRALCFSTDGRRLASGASDGRAILWHVGP